MTQASPPSHVRCFDTVSVRGYKAAQPASNAHATTEDHSAFGILVFLAAVDLQRIVSQSAGKWNASVGPPPERLPVFRLQRKHALHGVRAGKADMGAVGI
jgi:hypothetical protein